MKLQSITYSSSLLAELARTVMLELTSAPPSSPTSALHLEQRELPHRASTTLPTSSVRSVGTSQVHIFIPLHEIGYLEGGDPAGSATMAGLINTAASKCPSTEIVLGGYSQGAQLVHKAAATLSATVTARISAGKLFWAHLFPTV
jgi:hypothetical protein